MTTVHCPTCGKAIAWSESERWRPFCSERCRLIDLGEWFSEAHRIPGDAADNEEGEDDTPGLAGDEDDD
jgi:uncharacterized protein